ncbi:MAG: HNH endonuclease, partial [Quisquiliibacterium sp.]
MKLTQERLFDILDYDFETGIFRWKKTMRASAWAGDVAGDVKPNGYIRIYFDGRGYYAHRLAWFYFYGTWPKGDIDHINRKKD